MCPFRKGDRIKLVRNLYNFAAKAGATAVVIGPFENYLPIMWDRNNLDNGQGDGGYHWHDFDLAEPLSSFEQQIVDYCDKELGRA